VVAIAEIATKPSYMALLLAARFPRPLAHRVRHPRRHDRQPRLRELVGVWLVNLLGADAMRWIVGLSFIAMAAWALVPDSAPEEDPSAPRTACSSPP
jgi:putative Ca2+/H+ antiporter (TMEM165/GDT1 family)